ncbi:histidine--tRNA ligase [SAR86 cluster bacterium]|nr:histidine--tRNA ligase [SAR86 cluster bacterium]
MDKIKSLTGMPDYYEDFQDDNSKKIFYIEDELKKIFNLYNLKEFRTPALEDSSLFSRSVGDISDIVNKEIYSFEDKNKKNISLRPEGTAGIIRSIIQKKLDISSHKLWYIGPMWRYERPQKGRFRQFTQAGVEILGNEEGTSEFEMISIVTSIVNKFKLKNYVIKINHLGNKKTKDSYCTALKKFLENFKDNIHSSDLEKLEKNPLRILDSKSQETQTILKNAPSIKDFLDKESYDLLKKIKDTFSDIEIDFKLVRGLDYYSGFVFEANSSDLGAQDAILGGGRYDNLSKDLGGKDLPAIGMAIGIERLANLITIPLKIEKRVSFIILTSNLRQNAYKIANQLRETNNSVILDISLSDASIKAKLRRANKDNSSHAIIIGEDELKNNKAIIKSLENEKNEQQSVTVDELLKFYKSL